MDATKRTILYSCLLISGTFWLAYGLGYQHGHLRGVEQEVQAWAPVRTGGGTEEQFTWRRKPQYIIHQQKSVNAGPDSVTVR